MIRNPFQYWPYYDWDLDKWKIGISIVWTLVMIIWAIMLWW